MAPKEYVFNPDHRGKTLEELYNRIYTELKKDPRLKSENSYYNAIEVEPDHCSFVKDNTTSTVIISKEEMIQVLRFTRDNRFTAASLCYNDIVPDRSRPVVGILVKCDLVY